MTDSDLHETEKPVSEHNMEGKAYRVEVRCMGKPIPIGDGGVVATEWTDLPTVKTFPYGAAFQRSEDSMTYTYDYYGALALACSFMSAHRYMGAEARLVEYKRAIKWTLEKVRKVELATELEMVFAAREIAQKVLAEAKTK